MKVVLLVLIFSFQALAGFMEQAKNITRDLVQKILEHPFLLEVAEGSLPQDKFEYFARQDKIYSYKYAAPLMLLAMKTANATSQQFFMRAANDSTQEWSGPLPKNMDQCPSCQAYSDFELACATRSLQEGIAAIAPCYVIYWTVGQWLLNHTVPNNQYQNWMNQYANPTFGTHVKELEGIVDHEASQVGHSIQQTMLQLYGMAVRYEWEFWNSAYELATWEPRHDRP